MASMVKNSLWLIYLSTLFLFFNSAKSEIVIEEIIVNDTTLAIDSIEGNKYYHVNVNVTSNQSLYIVVFGGAENLTNHIISIYKDPEFIDRKQMDQSLDGLSYVMLNEEQIGTDFYLSIECAKLPCTYTLNLFYKNYLLLREQEPYTCYITEENKVMKFGLMGDKIKAYLDEGDVVLVYARGNKYITTQLEGLSYTKHSEYNVYIITNITKDPDEFGMLYFTVEAKVGDLINVGYLVFGNKYKNNTFSKTITHNGDEYIGFLKKGVIEQNSFRVEKEIDEDEEEIPEEEETIPDINPEEEESEEIPEEESEDIPEEESEDPEEESEDIPEEESEDIPEEESEDIPEEESEDIPQEEEKDDEEENYEEEETDKKEEEEVNEEEEEETYNEEEENEGKEEEKEEDEEKEEEEEEEEEEEGGKGPGNDDKKNTGLPTLYIIIIAIGGFIVIVAIIFILLKCRKKNTNEDIERLNIEKAFEKDVPLI